MTPCKEIRFQDSNLITKLWRCKWYLLIPFIALRLFLSHVISNNMNEKLSFKLCWSLAKGRMQIKMKWYYTNDEVMQRVKEKFKFAITQTGEGKQ
jgi:hypothetical protein